MIGQELGSVKSDLGHFVVDNGVTGLVAAVIIGNAGNVAIVSLISNMLMPIFNAVTGWSEEDWDKASVTVYGVEFKVRKFIADTISFFITVVVTFLFLQYFAIPLIAGSKFKA